jgi:hypothetical protein
MVALKKQDISEVLSGVKSVEVKLIAALTAIGLSASQIAKSVGIDVARVELIQGLGECSDLVCSIQLALSLSSEQRISASVNAAIDTKMRLLATTQDEKLRNAIATDLLDRNFGKATQMIQTVGVNVTRSVGTEELDSKLTAMQNRLGALEAKRKAITESLRASALIV